MNVFVRAIGVTARAGLAALFCGLAGAALHYALAAAPAGRGAAAWPMPALQVPWQAGLPAFAWTTAELACAEAYEDCNRERLVAEAPAAPLSARPFALQLAEEIISGDEAAAALMAAEVIRRDPRSSNARHVLAAAALRDGDTDGFLDLFLPLFDVGAAGGAAYADFLAGLSTSPEIRAALAPKLAAGAGWGSAYLSALTRRGGVSISELIALHVHVPQARAGFLQRLTSAGQWDMAYVAFAEFISADARGEDSGEALALTAPFNPQLRVSSAPAPFNWAIASRNAQLLKEGGAYAFYEGRTSEALLGQSFPLSPGAYTLAAEHSGEVTETGGFFRWQIACADGGPALARFDVRALEAAPSREAWDFELAPGTCPYLRLSLHGVPGGFPRPARIELKSVRLSARSPQAAAP